MFQKLKYDDLSHLQVGRIGEYWVKLNLTLLGFDIYTSEVDDKGIDFIIRINDQKHIDIQVKTIRNEKTDYVFVSKETWNNQLRENLYLALVILENEQNPKTYLIPSNEWANPNDLFRDRSYKKEGQKSKPEWGLNVSKKNFHLLEKFELQTGIKKLKNIYALQSFYCM